MADMAHTNTIKEHEPCCCPRKAKEILTSTPFEAATMGLIKEVRMWLNAGGDVNGTTIINEEKGIPEGFTLLAAACNHGQSEVVQNLVTLPSIHLNTRHNLDCGRGCTPLWVAAHLGHEDCVKVLLSAKTKCRIDWTAMAVTKKGEQMTVIMVAAKNQHWAIVDELMKLHNHIDPAEAAFITVEAAEENQWTTVQNILKKDIALPEQTFNILLNKAHEQNKWKVVWSILQQRFRNRNDHICEILSKVVEVRDWNKALYVINLLDGSLKLDVATVKAALSENYEKVYESIRKLDEATRDGVRLVVAVGGTSEEVAYLLYKSYYSRKKAVWESCIYLSSMNNRLEVLTHLIQTHRNALTYSVLSRVRGKAAKENLVDTERLLTGALTSIITTICR